MILRTVLDKGEENIQKKFPEYEVGREWYYSNPRRDNHTISTRYRTSICWYAAMDRPGKRESHYMSGRIAEAYRIG